MPTFRTQPGVYEHLLIYGLGYSIQFENGSYSTTDPVELRVLRSRRDLVERVRDDDATPEVVAAPGEVVAAPGEPLPEVPDSFYPTPYATPLDEPEVGEDTAATEDEPEDDED